MAKHSSYKVGDRIQVRIDAPLPKHLRFCRSRVGEVVRVVGMLSVRLDPINPIKATTSEVVLLEERWVDPILKPVESLKESEDSIEQPTIWEALTGECPSNSTKMRSQSSSITGKTRQFIETSETSSPSQENTIFSLVDSPVMEPAEPEERQGLIIQNQPSSGNSSDASVSADPNLYSWNNLKDLSIEDLEAGLEDSTWQDIEASLLCTLQLINLERLIKEPGCLSFPTLLSGDRPSSGVRPAGQTKCEKWWRDNVIQRRGLQLSARAMCAIQGYPVDWLDVISPPPAVIQGELDLDTSLEKQSPHPKPELPSVSSSGSGTETSSDGREANRLRHRTLPLEKPRASGWLEQQAKNTRLKGGVIATYPRVEGIRDPDNPEHWYWNYRYEDKSDSAKSYNNHITKAVPVKRNQVEAVKLAIARGWPVEKILSYIRGELG